MERSESGKIKKNSLLITTVVPTQLVVLQVAFYKRQL
jgi:hypothetical protein